MDSCNRISSTDKMCNMIFILTYSKPVYQVQRIKNIDVSKGVISLPFVLNQKLMLFIIRLTTLIKSNHD